MAAPQGYQFTEDINKNLVNKLLRLDDELRTLNVNNLALDNNYGDKPSRNRSSFHQNVEEALSSLLWQPYEYQNQNNNYPNKDTYSSCSSFDLDSPQLDNAATKNRRVPSFDCRDLHSGVINPTEYNQSEPVVASHDSHVACAHPGALSLRRDRGPTGSYSRMNELSSLSAANIVGLPLHYRNGSEPAQNLSQVSHARSSSVPKSMTLGPKYDVTASTNNNNVRTITVPPSNVSNVNVNFYRAVPINVPSIPCTNGNSVSNVQVLPLTGTSTTVQVNHSDNSRTFTNSEAQTDEVAPLRDRDQRRRERRERRQRRNNRASTGTSTEAVPDLLNNHLPPPYSTLPGPQQTPLLPPQILPPPVVVPSGSFVFPQGLGGVPSVAPPPVAVPVAVPAASTNRVAVAAAPHGFRFGVPNGFRRSRYSDDSPKGCCGFLSWKPGSLRWFIALIALVAVCCVLVGTALGAMRPAGRDHLTVSLLMIGVGIVLITVSGVAWRLTSHDSSTCRSMLGLGSTESVDVCTRRFVPRLPPSYGRPHHPYAAMMYPEFQYRPPPPSYQASMQEYRLRLLLLDRGNTPQIQAGIQNAVSPPPTYRSHMGTLLRTPLTHQRRDGQSEYSCPPSYRSQNSSSRPGTIQILHSRDPSMTESNQESVNVVNILSPTDEDIALDNITLDSLKLEPETDLNILVKEGEASKEGNLVTIVQTHQSPVIVTVSGSQENSSTVQIPSEMEILAHL